MCCGVVRAASRNGRPFTSSTAALPAARAAAHPDTDQVTARSAAGRSRVRSQPAPPARRGQVIFE